MASSVSRSLEYKRLPYPSSRGLDYLDIRLSRTAELIFARTTGGSYLARGMIVELKRLPFNCPSELRKISKLFESALELVRGKKAEKLRKLFDEQLIEHYRITSLSGEQIEKSEEGEIESASDEASEDELSSFDVCPEKKAPQESQLGLLDNGETGSEELQVKICEVESLVQLSFKAVFSKVSFFPCSLPAELAEEAVHIMFKMGVKFKEHYMNLLALTPSFILPAAHLRSEDVKKIFNACPNIATVIIYSPRSRVELKEWRSQIEALFELIKEGKKLVFTISSEASSLHMLQKIEKARILDFWQVLDRDSRKRCLLEGFGAFDSLKRFGSDEFLHLNILCQGLSMEELQFYKPVVCAHEKLSIYIQFVMGNDRVGNQRILALLLADMADSSLENLIVKFIGNGHEQIIKIEILVYKFFRLFKRLEEDKEFSAEHSKKIGAFLKENVWGNNQAALAVMAEAKHCPIIFEAVSALPFGSWILIQFLIHTIPCKPASITDKFRTFFLFIQGSKDEHLPCFKEALQTVLTAERLSAILRSIPEEISEEFKIQIIQIFVKWSKVNQEYYGLLLEFLERREDLKNAFSKIADE